MRSHWIGSSLLRKCVLYGVVPLTFAASGCGKSGDDDAEPNDLQALLDDGELDHALDQMTSRAAPAPSQGTTRATSVALVIQPGSVDGGGTAPGTGDGPVTGGSNIGGGGGFGGFGGGGLGGIGGGFGGIGGGFGQDAGVAVADAGPAVFDGGRGGACIPGTGGFMGGGDGLGGRAGKGGTGAGVPPSPPDASSGGALPFCDPNPLARWEMNDCNPQRTELGETFHGFTAFRSVAVRCVDGVESQGVSLPNAKDIVYVPDQPLFTFEQGVTVAAWLKPSRLTGITTVFRKREGGTTSSLALMLSGGRYTFVIDRAHALPAAVSAPATLNTWTHVAATYDGGVLRLYINGKLAASQKATGQINGGEGPLLLGNDANHRRFEGTIDKVSFDTRPASAETIFAMQCLHRPPTLSATPLSGPPTPIGTPVTFNFTIQNNDHPACGGDEFFLQSQNVQQGFEINQGFSEAFVPSGGSATVPVSITAGDDADTGAFPFTFTTGSFRNFVSPQPSVTVTFNVSASGCRVSTRRELMIRDVSVVDDPVRTGFSADASDARRGVWTFKHLMEQLAPSAAAAPDFVESLLHTYTVEQTVNGFTIPVRPGVQRLLDAWPHVDGKLDLQRAPMRLLAIVNRLDLRDLAEGHAGEGRFVFGFLSGDFPLQATMIFEFHQPAQTAAEIRAKVDAWHALGAKPFPSEEYNVALQALTESFVNRGADPSKPNDSALAQLRTNEIDFGDGAPWQMREFDFDAMGRLLPAGIKQTPDRPTFDGTSTLADFINTNEAAVLTETHTVPLTFKEAPFLSGAVFNDLGGWNAPGINNPEARHLFSRNTCNGCHSLTETNTFFLQVNPRFPGAQAQLSGFLTGTTAFDPFTGEAHFFNDLGRRNRDLLLLVCPADQIPPLPPPPVVPDPGKGGIDAAVSGSLDAGAPPPHPMMTGASGSPPAGTNGQPTTSLTKGIKRPD